jgi:L-ascorbate metabolism protein UlaG (beta-lactamase superfamily)
VNSDHSNDININWFGHSSFKIKVNDIILFFDPVRKNDLLRTTLNTKNEGTPDAIFISHDHWDHCDPRTIIELASQNTKIYGPQPIENLILHEISFEVSDFNELKNRINKTVIVKENEILTLHEASIKCLNAQEGLSYLVCVNNKKLLFMGDAVATEEMINEGPDIVLFPIWAVKGEEAKLEEFLVLAEDRLCIPMHFHTSDEALPNFYADMNEIMALLPGINLKILEKNRYYTL